MVPINVKKVMDLISDKDWDDFPPFQYYYFRDYWFFRTTVIKFDVVYWVLSVGVDVSDARSLRKIVRIKISDFYTKEDVQK